MNRETKRQILQKFIFSFLVTLTLVLGALVVGGGVYAGINALTRPPEIPTHVEIRPPVRTPISMADYFEYEDALPEEPESTFMERKPYFYTFMLFGVDAGNNTDVLMMAALDTVSRRAYVISVPRDTKIETDRRLAKPVSAYAVGRAGGRGHEYGVAELTSDVHGLFGFEPDFYVRVDFRAFERAVNAVGGVRVHVPIRMQYHDPTVDLRIDIAAGNQTLNGTQALHFARYRNSITDFQRMENQQQIVRVLFDALLTPASIARAPEFINIFRDHVYTDMTNREMLWFGEQLTHLRGAEISTYTLPIAYTRRAGWFEVPDRPAILELINRTVNPFTDDITAEMVNIAHEYTDEHTSN